MKFKRLSSPVRIASPRFVKVTTAGSIVKVVSMRESPGVNPIRRVDKETYYNLVTKQYGVYHKSKTKADLVDGVKKSLDQLRMIINANCWNARWLLWVTLTYAENMQDAKRLYVDFNRFMMRLKRYLAKNNCPHVEYIVVAEPQGRGAWHLHCILIFPHDAPFLPNVDVAKMWGQGFTKTKAVHGVDNLGAYFSAYLADMPVDEADNASVKYSAKDVLEKCVVDDEEKESKKKFVKGARLHLYPAGMKFYRCSQGVYRPKSATFAINGKNTVDDWQRLKEKAGLAEPTFSKSLVVVDDAQGGCMDVNDISVEYYNTLRKDCQVMRIDRVELVENWEETCL